MARSGIEGGLARLEAFLLESLEMLLMSSPSGTGTSRALLEVICGLRAAA